MLLFSLFSWICWKKTSVRKDCCWCCICCISWRWCCYYCCCWRWWWKELIWNNLGMKTSFFFFFFRKLAASGLSSSNGLSRSGLNAWSSGRLRRWLRGHPVFDFSSHSHESLLNVCRVLGRCLEEGDAELIGKLLGRVKVYCPLRRKIALVSDEKLVDVFAGVAIDFVQPLFNVVEGFLVGNVVNDDDSVCPSVIGRCNSSKALCLLFVSWIDLLLLLLAFFFTHLLFFYARACLGNKKQINK